MAALEVVHQTWFGSNEEYVSGINMLPFTPISENLLPYDFMAQLWPLMKTALDRYVFICEFMMRQCTCAYTYCVLVLFFIILLLNHLSKLLSLIILPG